MRSERVLAWFREGLEAVEPRRRTAASLSGSEPGTVIAIGKAAAAMTRGAGDALGPITGVCVTDAPAAVPQGIELLIGDHPLPGEASFAAGRRALEVARQAQDRVIALVSGGGSALCEEVLPGVPPDFTAEVTRALLSGGASIGDTNMVRSHLSAIKSGGLARAVHGELETLVLSDVGGLGPEVVASGPTLTKGRDPELALEILARHGITVPSSVEQAMRSAPSGPVWGEVAIIGDGRDAGRAVCEAAGREGLQAQIDDDWLDGAVQECVERFVSHSRVGVTVAAGEATVEVAGDGRGGRNTHAALLAAELLQGQNAVFASLATDGVDGKSGAAGAIVDGSTIARGGDPGPSVAGFDSAAYLEASGDLVVTGRTGTNVADLWVLWRW